MIGFKSFYLQEENKKVNVPTIDNLLLNDHDSVGVAADMTDGVHNILSGKKSKIKTILDYPGLSVSFGYSPSSKKLQIIHNNNVNETYEDIQKNYANNPKLMQTITDLSKHLPKILPLRAKMYNGKVLGANTEKLALSVDTDENMAPLKDSDRNKFSQHPDVFNLNPELTPNIKSHNVDNQQLYLMYMNSAKKHYRKIDPGIYDYISDHGKNMIKYINDSVMTDQEPNSKDYLEYLKQLYGGKILNSPSEVTKNNRSKRFTELANQVTQNEKDYDNFIKFMHHFKKGVNILSQSLPHDLIVYHGGRMVKIKKNKMNEETVTTSTAMASDGAFRGLGYVTGNPGGQINNYITKNTVDSDQRNNILFKYFKDYHHKHHKSAK